MQTTEADSDIGYQVYSRKTDKEEWKTIGKPWYFRDNAEAEVRSYERIDADEPVQYKIDPVKLS